MTGLAAILAFTVVSARADKPALELKKAVSFALDGNELPSDAPGLSSAILGGLRKRVSLLHEDTVVRVDSETYPNLKSLTVDLTDASVNIDHKAPKMQLVGPMEDGVAAEEFRFVAQPMNIDGAKIDLDVQAKHVQLGLGRDKDKHPILMLRDAREGSVQCQTTCNDLSMMFRNSANDKGKKFGLSVQKARVKLQSQNEHQIAADLHLASKLLILPISLHFTAKVDVDEKGNAHISNLTCNGDDIAGWLILGVIRPSLNRYNNKTMPLVAFPSESVKLHDVKVTVKDEVVSVAAAFGE